MEKDQNYSSALFWASIAAAISLYFFHGHGHAKQVDTYQNIILGKSWQELRDAKVCSIDRPVGISNINQNTRRVKFTTCFDFKLFGDEHTVVFEFIDQKLTRAAISMNKNDTMNQNLGAWKKVFPVLEKQYGKPDRQLSDEDVAEKYSEDIETPPLVVKFGAYGNIMYQFGANSSADFESLILQTSSRDKNFKDAAQEQEKLPIELIPHRWTVRL